MFTTSFTQIIDHISAFNAVGRGGLAPGRQGVTDDWALSGIGPLSDWALSQAMGPYEGPNWKLDPAKKYLILISSCPQSQ